LRPFGRGLLESRPVAASMMAFILLLLATVLYDGLIGTGEWALLEDALREGMPSLTGIALRSAGLLVIWLLFLGAYLGICAAMSWVASGSPRPLEVARCFALTLIPIAIGYHVAHYLVFLLVQGQYIIPLVSDPFGRGWDLFGTAGYRVDIAIAGARFAWYMAVAAIVTGHVLAVYLAHRRAIEVFAPVRVALATQVLLTALMVSTPSSASPSRPNRSWKVARRRPLSPREKPWRSRLTPCSRRPGAGACCPWGRAGARGPSSRTRCWARHFMTVPRPVRRTSSTRTPLLTAGARAAAAMAHAMMPISTPPPRLYAGISWGSVSRASMRLPSRSASATSTSCERS
jgi:hypothetical protein